MVRGYLWGWGLAVIVLGRAFGSIFPVEGKSREDFLEEVTL